MRIWLWHSSPLSGRHKLSSLSSFLSAQEARNKKDRSRSQLNSGGGPLKCLLVWLLFVLQGVFAQQPLRRRTCPGGFPTDNHDFCPFWAMIGECARNAPFMRPNCNVSCFGCPSARRFAVPAAPQMQQPSLANAATLVQAQPFPVSATCARVQTVEIATRIVPTREEFENLLFRMGCATMNQENICAQNACFHERFRTLDGSCNDLQHSLKGAAFMPFARLQPANYEDGIARMVGTSKQLPNPRVVTHMLLSSSFVRLTRFNGLLMQFGQLLSHDITRNAIPNIDCKCTVSSSDECFAMPIPRHDTRLRKPFQTRENFGCIPLKRSAVLCGTGSGRTGPGRTPRTPINMNTAWIDASHIYGSDPKSARVLRVGALLRTLPLRIPPFSALPPTDPKQTDRLLVGDNRNNLFVGLATLHSIFVRLHNRLATQFFQLNPHWEPERVYQETRKIVAAVMQVVTYQEFLPALLGGQFSQRIPPYAGYQPNVEPAVSVEFAAASYRLHGLIREFYELADRNFRKIGDVKFVSNAGSVDLLLQHGTDQLIRGLMMIASKFPQRLAPGVTDELFDISDMGSLNIQRGRDQGLRPYNAYRVICGLPPLRSFQQWPEVPDQDAINRVASLYKSVDDIDLYVGGLLEAPANGALVGPTIACIIGEQFTRTRNADRFYFENTQMYTAAQIAALKRVTFAFVICATGEDFQRINANAFLVETGQTAVPCSSLPQLDLGPWREMAPQQQGK